MPKMYNPDTQETVEVPGPEVKDRRAAGFLSVGERPEEEYVGKSREELTEEEEAPEEPAAPEEAPPEATQLPAEEPPQ
jgi:hypothetical protein